MADYIVASAATREAVEEDFIDFLGKLTDEGKIQQPRAILGIDDVTSEDPLGWIADMARIGHAFEKAGYEGSTDETRAMQDMLENIQRTGPAARPTDHDRMVGGIILHHEVDNERYLPAAITNIPEEDLNINLNKQSLERYYLLHEAAHIEHGHLPGAAHVVQKEFEADNKANTLYYEAYQQGLVTDPEVPYAVRAMRAIDTVFDFSDGGYRLNGVTVLPGEEPIVGPELSMSDAVEDIDLAKEQLQLEVGKLLTSESSITHLGALQSLQWQDVEGAPPFELSDEINDRINDIIVDRDEEAAAQLLSEIEIPEAYREVFESEVQAVLEIEQQSAGAVYMQDNPNLVYETAKMMMERGDFRDRPAANALMENFIDGVERYAPDHFGVAPDDRPQGQPAIVQQLATDYAPSTLADTPDIGGIESPDITIPAGLQMGAGSNR